MPPDLSALHIEGDSMINGMGLPFGGMGIMQCGYSENIYNRGPHRK
jgi:hypothetical protein